MLGVALLLGATAVPASAANFTLSSVTFTDGTPLTGSFMTNTYGYIEQSSVDMLSVNGAITGWSYLGGYGQPDNFGIVLGATEIDFYRAPGGIPDYTTDLHLAFAVPVHAGVNLLDTADTYECIDSYTCYLTGGSGDRRYITSGALDVPEPMSLAVLGSSLLGLGVLRRKCGQ